MPERQYGHRSSHSRNEARSGVSAWPEYGDKSNLRDMASTRLELRLLIVGVRELLLLLPDLLLVYRGLVEHVVSVQQKLEHAG